MKGNAWSRGREALALKWKGYRERTMAMAPVSREEKRQEARRLARFFVCFALICGMLITFIVPPFCAPDEQAHFINSWCMSRGDFFGEPYENHLVRWIPSYYRDFVWKFPGEFTGVDSTTRFTAQDIYLYTSNSWDQVNETPEPVYTAITSTGYLVSAASMALGTGIGNLLHSKNIKFPYNQMLLGRIGNLLFYVIVIYFAIRRSPHFNRTMTLVGLMPMALFQGCSLSYDAVLIPLCMYLTALVLDLHTEPEKPISNMDILRVLACVFFIAGMKFAAYTPLLALLLTVPKTKYGSTKRMILCIAAVAVTAVIGYLPNIIINNMSAQLDTGITPAMQQTEWVKGHPGELPGIYGTTFIKYGVVYLYGFWGLVGQLDTYFPIPIILMGLTVTGLTALSEACSFDLWKGKRWKNLLALVGGLISALGIMLAMYIYFSAEWGEGVGGPFIDGVQGRYFIPLVLCFALAVSNPLLQKTAAFRSGRADRVLNRGAALWGGCCAVMTVMVLLMKYWIG